MEVYMTEYAISESIDMTYHISLYCHMKELSSCVHVAM